MRRIVVATFVSLDGVMQAPGGPEEDPTGGFKFGGWIVAAVRRRARRPMGEMFGQPFDLLLGRKTYDIFAAHWPYVDRSGRPDRHELQPGRPSTSRRASPTALTWKNSRRSARTSSPR